MDDVRSLKKRLLAQAVRENLEAIEGKPPQGLRRGGRLRRRLVRAVVIVAVPALLFVSINAISLGRGGPEVVVVPQRPAALVPAPAQPSTVPKLIDPTVFHLAVQSIVVDAGHGGQDPGARTPRGLFEKDVTLDVALRLRTLLEGTELKVSLTRDRDETVSLKERARRARASAGDLLVSIHVNSIPSPSRRGVETYVVGPTDDPFVQELAGAENRASGYSLADFRRLLEGVYAGVRQAESHKLAAVVQTELVHAMGRAGPGVEDRGVKSAPFVVLIASEMPGILAEVSCISNEEEARRLADPAYRQGIAEALFRAVRSYAAACNQGTDGKGV